MTPNDIKPGDVLVRPHCKCTVLKVTEGEKGKLAITMHNPATAMIGTDLIPTNRRNMMLPAGAIEKLSTEDFTLIKSQLRMVKHYASKMDALEIR